jgi:NitT/TauT family transport system substrate-binding protein
MNLRQGSRNAYRGKRSATALFLFSTLLAATAARAEGTIGIAQQYGIGYLILDVVRDNQLIEKQGKAQGLDIKVEWRTLSGATGLNEGCFPARWTWWPLAFRPR